MAKRELFERIKVEPEGCRGWWYEDKIVPEREIVRPYLTKLRSDIVASIEDIKGKYDNTVPEHDKPLCKCARNEARLEIIEWIDGLLAELGDKE